jgi:glutamyl-tRNA reductase
VGWTTVTVPSGAIGGVRVTHERADVDTIGAAGSGDTRTDLDALLAHAAVEEAYVLRTCNRSEAYVVTEEPDAGAEALAEFVADVPAAATVWTDHEGSIRHLLRVAAGLDSMVLGEHAILGQVRSAYETARGVGAVGPVLEEAVPKAIHVGERVRSETAIGEGARSLGSAAVRFLADRVPLDSATVLLVGAGEMSSTVASQLADREVGRLVVVNRSLPAAAELTASVDAPAEADEMTALADRLATADAVVAATGAADPLVDVGTALEAGIAGDDGPACIVDMGQPRDVAPPVDEVEGVSLHDLDDLRAVTERTHERRQTAAEAAERMVETELDHLLEQFKRKRADAVVAAMRRSADRVKRRELETALSKLDAQGEFTEAQRETVEALADALVGQLMAAPTKSLREAAAEDDWETIGTAIRLFDPEFGADPPEGVDLPVDVPTEADPTPADDA